MIESIEFKNYKALRSTRLSLSPFTILLGPNGSGKSSVMQAIEGLSQVVLQKSSALARGPVGIEGPAWHPLRSVTTLAKEEPVEIVVRFCRLWREDHRVTLEFRWPADSDQVRITHRNPPLVNEIVDWFSRVRTFAFDPTAIAEPASINANPLQSDGRGLASVLDDIKDNHPERWESLIGEMRKWLPEYDYIQFDKPIEGKKQIAMRTKKGGHRIPAQELSQGTLVALALLTLAYQPNPPSLIGLEEIDRGLHPRLLRHLQDALYRLSYPESCGEKRRAIQVIATTHSPYLLDLYRDRPEEVVLAQKEGLEATMRRLSEIEHFGDILGDSPLSEVWYSGVLGGVSVKP